MSVSPAVGTTTPPPVVAGVSAHPNRSASQYAWCAVVLFFATANVLWFAFDHHVPFIDEAGHILMALQCKELLRHPHLLRGQWWHDILSVNSFYPPGMYLFNGLLKLVLGNGRWVDVLSMVFFSSVLTTSTYFIGVLCQLGRRPSLIAAILINLYPLCANLAHCYLLDYPLTALIAAALSAMLWWLRKPTWSRAVLCAVAVSAACMSKQVGAAYLGFPGIWCAWEVVRRSRMNDVNGAKIVNRGQLLSQLVQLSLTPTLLLAMAVPWVLTNAPAIRSYSHESASVLQSMASSLTPLALLGNYVVGLWYSLSPLFAIAFVLAFLLAGVENHRKLVPVYLTALGGLCGLCFLGWTLPFDRYISTVLLACALVTACGASRLRTTWLLPIVAVAFAQYLSYSFSPYPLDQPELGRLSARLGVQLRISPGLWMFKDNPYKDGLDWGQQWCLDKIAATDGDAPVFLNILPSTGYYNPHSWELLAKEQHKAVRPTTIRYWTHPGDRVDFSPKTALYYQWYLLKDGKQGHPLANAEASKNYAELMDFVRNSGHFKLMGTQPLPDKSTLYLYRQQP